MKPSQVWKSYRMLLALGGFIIFGMAWAVAQVITGSVGPPTQIACATNTTPATPVNGQGYWVQCDITTGALLVGGTVTATATNPVGITPTDRTLTSATGASQTLMAANATRHGLIVQNTGNANCGVNPTGGTAVIAGAGTLTLVPQGSYQPRIPTLSAVTVICTAGQPLYAEEN